MKKTLLHSVLLLLLLSMAGNLVAQEKGLFSIFANFGGATLEDKDVAPAPDSSVFNSGSSSSQTSNGNVKIKSLKLGLGFNYAHPVSKIFSVGVMVELHLLFNKTKYRIDGDIKISSDSDNLGLGIAFGAYFRLGLWGTDKKAGIGFAPYFLVNFLRPEMKSTQIANGAPIDWTDKPVLSFGGGLMLDVYLTKNFGINFGAEIQGGNFNSKYPDGSAGADVFGPSLYGGIIISL